MTTSSRPTGNGVEIKRALDLAFILARHGRLNEALALYQRILAAQPDHLMALCGLSDALQRSGQPQDAASAIAKAEADVSARAHFHLATTLCHLGRHEAAAAHYREAVALEPDWAEARHNLGVALQALGRYEEALPHHEKAAALNPKLVDAQASLGKLHRIRGRPENAVEHYRSALALKPDDADLLSDLAGVLLKLGRADEAQNCCRRALAIAPGHAAAHFNLAVILQETDDPTGAVEHYQRTLALRPDFAEAQNNLGNALQRLGRFTDAASAYEKAFLLKPDYADAHANLGKALQLLGRDDDALAQFEAALGIDSSRAALHNQYAVALLAAGRVSEAQSAFEKAAQLAPEKVIFHFNLASFRRFTTDDPRLPALEKFASNEETLGQDDRIALHFALGKACSDLEQPDKAFGHLIKANRLKRSHTVYDEEAALRHFDDIRAIFTLELLRERRGAGAPSPTPVFVIGMPRSGTTLIEQILSSHSCVYGAGELDVFSRIVADLSLPRETLPPFPRLMQGLSREQLRGIGERYLDIVGEMAPDAARIVDKMPANFVLAGLIHLALPDARIVHARRDPVDTCFSCYSLLFAEDQPYAYDLGELGRYYRAYAGLMDHWRRVLPPGIMIDVQYEDLVGDFDRQARRLLAHCGLEWQDSCSAFHETRRTVRTASVAQVRKPLYADSIGRWRPYAAHLRPLLQELGVGADHPVPG